MACTVLEAAVWTGYRVLILMHGFSAWRTARGARRVAHGVCARWLISAATMRGAKSGSLPRRRRSDTTAVTHRRPRAAGDPSPCRDG